MLQIIYSGVLNSQIIDRDLSFQFLIMLILIVHNLEIYQSLIATLSLRLVKLKAPRNLCVQHQIYQTLLQTTKIQNQLNQETAKYP